MSIPFPIEYLGASLDQGLEIFEAGSKVRLKTVDDILALFHFDDAVIGNDNNLYSIADAVAPPARERAIGIHEVTTVPGIFGNAAQILSPSAKILLPAKYETWGQLSDLSIRFRYLVTDIGRTPRNLMSRGIYSSASFRLVYQGSGIGLVCSSDGSNEGEINFTGAIAANTPYEVQAVMGADKFAALSLDGVEKISISDWDYLPLFNPSSGQFCPVVLSGGLNSPGPLNMIWCLDELIFYRRKMPTNYTLADSATKPFYQSSPTAAVSLDSTADDSGWSAGSLEFTDESDFNGGGIKLRSDASNNPTPAFSGSPITLSVFRALGSLRGRYLHLEFTFDSDGDTPRTLTSGRIQLSPSSLTGLPRILARQQPEIVRR